MGLMLLPRNRLQYPAGRMPGFDPKHIAAKGMTSNFGVSAVPWSGNLVNLLNSKPGTLTGTPTQGVSGGIGPSLFFPLNGSAATNSAFSWSTTVPAGMTIACIGLVLAITTTQTIATNNSDTSLVLGGGTGSVNFFAVSGFVSSSVTISSNEYCFIIGSMLSGSRANFLVMNLVTGQIQTSTVSTSNVFHSGSWTLAGGTTANTQFNGSISTIMWSPTYLSLPEMLDWARDPWGFWYPDRGPIPLVGHPSTSVAFAVNDAVDTAAFSLSNSNQFHFGFNDAIDTPSFTLQNKNQFHFGMADAIDTAAFNFTPENDFHFSVNDAVDAASFTLQKTNNFHFSVNDAVDTAAFSLSELGIVVRFSLSDAADTASFLLERPIDFSFANTDAVDLAAFSISQISPPPVIPTGEIADYVFRYENFYKAYADPVVRPYFRKGVMISLNALIFQLGQEVPVSALPMPGYWFVLSLSGPINVPLYLDPNLAFIINRTGQSWNNATPVYRAPQFSQVNRLEILVASSMIYVQ